MGMIDGESLISEMPWLVELAKGKKIKDITRIDSECQGEIEPNQNQSIQPFLDCYGPLLLQLEDGLVIGVKTERRVKSLSYWLEDDGAGNGDMVYNEKRIQEDSIRLIKYSDIATPPRNILGKEIINLSLIKSKIQDPIYTTMPNQWGLKIELTNDNYFFLGTSDLGDCDIYSPGFFLDIELDFNKVEQQFLPLDKLLYLNEPRTPSYLKLI